MTDVSIPALPPPDQTAVKRPLPRAESDRDAAPRTRPPRKAPGGSRLGGHTTKRYDMTGDSRRTVRHLREILNAKGIPADAVATLAESTITLDWDE